MLNYNLNFVVASTVFASLALFGLFKVLFLLRKKFPVKVNCWFCNINLRVPYESWNSFTCPKCQQYNGFTDDGNYNKEITEQHYSKLNTNAYCQKSNGDRLSYSNGFCEFCTRNQELKIHQLANFRPRCEDNYDEEIEEFRQKLEDSYQLCNHCQGHLNKTLNKIKTKFIGSKLSQLGSKLNKNLHQTAKIIVDDGKVISYFITSIILLLSIANFIRDMKVKLPAFTNDEKILDIFNHFRVFVYTIIDMMTNWMKELKLNEFFDDIDRIAISALILNSILIFNNLKNIRIPVIISMALWATKMMLKEVPFDVQHESAIKGTMSIILIVSSILLFKEKKKEELDVTNNGSFHKIPTEMLEESDIEIDLSETSSFFDHRSNKTVFSKSSRMSSSFRTSYAEPIKTLNSTIKHDISKPIDILSNKSFSITKEVLTADRHQVQNDITRLKLSDKNEDIFSTTSTIKDFNNSQYSNPFSLERSRCDSPAPSVASLFSTSTRAQLISPPRLHSPLVYTSNTNSSWVAGGYWQSPQKKYLNGPNPMMSRSSSQSSGLGTIDGSDKNSQEDSLSHEDATSLFSDQTLSHRQNIFEMPPSRSLFSNTQFFNQPINHNFFNNTYSNNNNTIGSFRKYREANTFFK
ncbi:hypothetical protein ACKWTF_010382 [Chironomus riparius]